MAEICLCRNENCTNKDTCLRFKSEETDMSSFAEFKNICSEENDFQWYWKTEEETAEETA